MRFSLTVVDGGSGQQADVLVDADRQSTVGELLPAFGRIVGDQHPTFAARAPVWVDGRPVGRDVPLSDAGIQPGAVVSLNAASGSRAGLPRGVAEIRVVGGPGAGRVHRIGLGQTVLGCGAPGLSLPDVHLPADALTLSVAPDGVVSVAASPQVQASIEQEPVAAERPWPPGAYLSCGETVLQLVGPWEPDADVSVGEGRLGLDVNRPPRLLPPARERAFLLPASPGDPPKAPIPWAMVLAPIVMSGVTALVFGPRYLLFGLMSPVMILVNLVTARRGSAREHRERTAAYRADLAAVEARMGQALLTEREDRRVAAPDPAETLLNAVGPGRRLWERRRHDPDYLHLRLGLARRPSVVALKHTSVRESEPPPPRLLDDVPVTVSLRDSGVVGVAGDQDRTAALARWLVGQSVALQSPRDLRVVILTDAAGEERWGWTRWLPHCRVDGETVPAMLGTDQESIGRRIGELGTLVTERTAVLSSPGGPKLPPAPDYLVVLDGARRLRTLPGVVQLLQNGPAAGVGVLCLDQDEAALPEECRAVVGCMTDGTTLRQTFAEDVPAIRVDQVEPAWADRLGRALAPLRDTTPSEDDSGLPAAARLLDCIGLPHPSPEGILGRWGPQAHTEVVLGEGFDGPFRLDLRRDGPHALIAGTTGSGKSELLQTLVASLAVANRPDQLTFVLVDYKGGSAFKECAKLPHTVGMVTDLDTHLVGRALTSLGAELRRREHLLAVPGAKDLEDYWALQRSNPDLPTIPRLVLVIDEFASLKAELPDFVTGLVTIAQRGRSLGIHLVLATQRPSGVVSADIRANTNLRIALRVTDDSESRDVIDAPEAARIGQRNPGRGYARTGHSSLLPFQSGRVGGRSPDADAPAVAVAESPLVWEIPWGEVGHAAPGRPRPAGSDTDEGDTDLSVLVRAITGADHVARIPRQASPWLPALAPVVTVDELRRRLAAQPGRREQTGDCAGAPAPSALAVPTAPVVPSVPWALEDRPDEQAQVPRTFSLGTDGHLFLVGGARSGRSTALRTIAGALAQDVPVRDLHLYGLDCGNGALLPLALLPHTGAVVRRTEVERAGRMLQRLTEEAARRQDLLGQGGLADIGEQRAAAAPGERLPYIVLLLDRWEGFVSDLGDVDMGRLTEDVTTLLREGASVGIQVVMSGDRTLLGGRIAALVERKFVLRLPERSDYTSAGLKVRDVPDNLENGRGLWADVGTEAQIGVLAADTSGAGQSAALRAIAEGCAERDADLPPALRPMRLGVLPPRVAAEDVLAQAAGGATPSALFVPLGVGGDALDLLGVDCAGGPCVLVSGPPVSGRTSALRFVASYAEQQGRGVFAFTPRDNALSAQLGERCLVGTEHAAEDVISRIRELGTGSVLLVDDAESLREGALAPLLLAVVKQARDKGLAVVVAGAQADLGTGFSGWIFEARKSRQGLVLAPQEVMSGELLGARIQRTALQAKPLPGRGVLVTPDGEQTLVQVPLV